MDFCSSPRRVRSVGEKCPGGFGCLAGKPPGWTGTLIAVDWQGVSAIDSHGVGGLGLIPKNA